MKPQIEKIWLAYFKALDEKTHTANLIKRKEYELQNLNNCIDELKELYRIQDRRRINAYEKYLESIKEKDMSHKKIIKSCEKKLMKDAKHYHKEEKEAKQAIKGLKKAISKPKATRKSKTR